MARSEQATQQLARLAEWTVDGLGLAECTQRGAAPTKSVPEPMARLTFAADGEELRLALCHCASDGVHTGGHLWSGSRQLAAWLYPRRRHLAGLRCLELGCGLALPSVLCAKSGAARALATDELASLVGPAQENARRNGAVVEAARLDFTSRADVQRFVAEAEAAAEGFDLLLFSDCVYSGLMGAALPHALALLLHASPGALAVGVFPAQIRSGVDTFWREAARVLTWREPAEVAGADGDPRLGRLFVFRLREGGPVDDPAVWADGPDEAVVGSLFDDVEAG